MKKLIIIITIFAALGAYAQNNAAIQSSQPFIEVTGTAEKQIVPDIIYINILLKDKSEGKNNFTIEQQEQKLKDILKEMNIDKKDISLSDAGSEIIKYKGKEKGIEYSKEYIIKLRTAEEVSRFFKALYNNNFKEAYISKTDHSKIEDLQKEVRIMAVKAAKDKATYLLQAIGEEPDKPLEVSEVNIPERFNYMANNVNYYDEKPQQVIETDFKKMTIRFSYNVKFSIK